jgi:hypothetical protein
VIVPRGRHQQAGLRIHRPRTFPLDDVVDHEGLRVTTVARTLLDLAATAPRARLEALVHEAGVQRVFDAASIYEACARAPCHRGRRKLEAALHAEVAPTRSGLERAFLALCERAGVPRPVVNGHLPTTAGLEEVDFHWPSIRLAVETDGARFHASRWRRRRDAEKAARLEAAGWTVRRHTDLEVAYDTTAIAAQLRALHAVGSQGDV